MSGIKLKNLIIILFVFITMFIILSYNGKKIEKTSSSKNFKYSSFTFFSLDTVIDVKYGGENRALERKIKSEFDRIYKKFSPSFRESIIYKINNRRGSEIKIDKETLYLIKESLKFYKESSKVFDITVKPLLDIWGFENEKKKVPSKKEIVKTLKYVSSERINLKGDKIVLPSGFKIDLGGIAKGYAVDRAAKIFKKSGITNFLINAGGDLIARGVNDRGKPWIIGIQHPRKSGVIKIFRVENRAVATSGDYQRYFVSDGIRYCHILSPFIGYPFRKWVSMTVVAEKCITADALSTAFFGMDVNSIKKTINKYFKDVKFYGIKPDMSVYTNFDRE